MVHTILKWREPKPSLLPKSWLIGPAALIIVGNHMKHFQIFHLEGRDVVTFGVICFLVADKHIGFFRRAISFREDGFRVLGWLTNRLYPWREVEFCRLYSSSTPSETIEINIKIRRSRIATRKFYN